MAVEILLVRHGESEGNRDRRFTGHGPSPLTPLGERQAEAVADALGGRPITRIYSSDLRRCVQTAAPLARRTGHAPIETPALRERDVGEFTGRDFADVQRAFADGWTAMLGRDPDYRPPGGESHADCARRVAAFLDEVLAGAGAEARLVIFSHGVAINHMLRHVVGLPAHADQRTYFQVDNCSIQRFEQHLRPGAGAGGTASSIRVLSINDVAHLVALAPVSLVGDDA